MNRLVHFSMVSIGDGRTESQKLFISVRIRPGTVRVGRFIYAAHQPVVVSFVADHRPQNALDLIIYKFVQGLLTLCISRLWVKCRGLLFPVHGLKLISKDLHRVLFHGLAIPNEDQEDKNIDNEPAERLE